jgi:hypothetical protein
MDVVAILMQVVKEQQKTIKTLVEKTYNTPKLSLLRLRQRREVL